MSINYTLHYSYFMNVNVFHMKGKWRRWGIGRGEGEREKENEAVVKAVAHRTQLREPRFVFHSQLSFRNAKNSQTPLVFWVFQKWRHELLVSSAKCLNLVK